MEEVPDMKKIIIGIVVGTLVLAGVIYAGSKIFQKNNSKLTLPIRNNEGTAENQETENPPTAPLRFTAADDVAWLTYIGKAYSFSFPQGLVLQKFTNPPDSVGIAWGNLDPKTNLLADIQSIAERSPQYAGKPEEFVKNWWKLYSGLKGVLSTSKFTNANGLTGYKAIFINTAGQAPNVDIFIQLNGDKLVHLANGVLDPGIFNRIVDSVKRLQ